MKRSVLLFFLCLSFSGFIYAQGLQIYGLQSKGTFDPNGNNSDISLNLIAFDPINGTSDTLYEISNSFGAALGASSFDQGNGRYIYWGIDQSNGSKLYNVNVNDPIDQQIVAINSRPLEIEYDMQTNQTYGLLGDNTTFNSIASVDLTTGTMTPIGTLPNVDLVAVGSSTYDSNNGRYFFLGGTSSGGLRLITVDVATGQIIEDAPLQTTGNDNLHFFQYDVVSDKLYALHSDITITQNNGFPEYDVDLYLVEVDPVTGFFSNVNDTPLATGDVAIVVGGVTLEQQTQLYFIQVYDDGQQKILAVDVNSGSVVASPTVSGQFVELQANNQAFANNFYGGTTSIEEASIAAMDVYPNPTSNQLNIEFTNDFTPETIGLFNAQGRFIRGINIQNGTSNILQVDVSHLANGVYFLDIQGNKERVRQSFTVMR